MFRRGGNHGEEMIEDDLQFKQANVYNMMSVYLERGEPTRMGWKRVKFFVSSLYQPDWTVFAAGNIGKQEVVKEPHDSEFFTFLEPDKIAVRVLDTVG